MGRKSMARKPKLKDRTLAEVRGHYADRDDILVMTREEYTALENATTKAAYSKAKEEYRNSMERTLNAVYGCAELNALVQIVRLTALAAHDLFGFGKVRIARLTEYILLQYDCILDDRVTFAEIAKEIKELTGLTMPAITQDDLAKLMNEEIDNEGTLVGLFREMKCKNLYEMKVKEGEDTCDTQTLKP